jgi:hypothetical protein
MGSGGVAPPLHCLEDDGQVSPERARERVERLARREVLKEARKGLMQLPAEEWFEIPGRCVWYCAVLLSPAPLDRHPSSVQPSPFKATSGGEPGQFILRVTTEQGAWLDLIPAPWPGAPAFNCICYGRSRAC